MNAGSYGGLALLGLLLAVSCGCGGGTERRPVHGEVKVHGAPVPRGSISFLPAAGASGPAANAPVVDGRYRFTDESGPHPGRHRVVIEVDPGPARRDTAGRGAAGEVKAVDPKAGAAQTGRGAGSRARARPAARRQWQTEYTVPEQGGYRQDFDLSGG